jgi:hypothetical protein
VHLAGWRSERQLSCRFLPQGRLADGAWPVESGESAVRVTAASRGSRTPSNPRSHHGALHGLGRGTGNRAKRRRTSGRVACVVLPTVTIKSALSSRRESVPGWLPNRT